MSWSSWCLWGFAATVVLTTLMEVGQALGLTRMNLPFMLGTMLTRSRDRAKVYGFFLQLVLGLGFSLLYVVVFHALGLTTWWLGGLLGLLHAAFVLAVLMPILPSLHPHMASEESGPAVGKELEPPGLFATHYGIQTPISVLVSHVVFGITLGALYQPP